ncbi:TPA: molecular chaperone [Pseudomonas aeruginosa]|uniref:fimbrial biogenesis chaperone n=1 Tax=Pseudomonas aeruginosa TaxID=287 RepID=UPI001F4AB200|nr:fimbria/pilus periplasmic chaperone [Pseudomonas aeruginosa]MDI3755895.1 fimbria/pilus periplasmic chaperone [Pseudomonas aeruginosa]MDI3999449.1 fimbria/pilus periplasmic chaperone [Pseudomonas aeruginosa]HCF1748753.1 fimbria/pilus periplasmic chaperone [Pseudomonas aeruginosa]
MIRLTLFIRLIFLCVSMLAAAKVSAGVVITGTRLIYPADQKEITVRLDNAGVQPALVQSWLDTGNIESTPAQSKAPFLILPPVARIDPGKGQTLRVMFTDAAIAQDRESVFWLNVLDIPPSPQGGDDLNTLQMAFRSRIKLFYRPEKLVGTASEAIEQVKWRVVPARTDQRLELQAYNPSAFHVTLIELELVDGSRRERSEDVMISPGETRTFPLSVFKDRPGADAYVQFNAINDYGALVSVRRVLSYQ